MANLVGQTLGSYKLTRHVADGGQAALYESEHIIMGRKAAIKLLHPHLIGNADFLKKFIAESQLLGSLRHPHIVAIYDAGVTQGHYWIAMEWLAGATIQELIDQQGPLEVKQAARIAAQVAEALAYAHANNLIHRDIINRATLWCCPTAQPKC